jgi:hypothetical protein
MTDPLTAGFAGRVARDLPPREPVRELTQRQLAELRRTMPAFKELEAKTLRSRGVNVWWAP